MRYNLNYSLSLKNLSPTQKMILFIVVDKIKKVDKFDHNTKSKANFFSSCQHLFLST